LKPTEELKGHLVEAVIDDPDTTSVVNIFFGCRARVHTVKVATKGTPQVAGDA